MTLDSIILYIINSSRRRVTLQQVMDGAGRPPRPALRVLDKLEREGYLEQISDQLRPGYRENGPPRRNPTWRVIRDLAERPRPNRPRSQSMRSRIWRAVRAKRRFTKQEVAVIAEASADSVDEYVRGLERHGYVRRTGKDGRRVVYILVRWRQVEPPAGLFGSDQ